MSQFFDELSPNIIRDLANTLCGPKLGAGSGRTVFVCNLDPGLVVKIETSGFQNVVEHEIWRAVKSHKQ